MPGWREALRADGGGAQEPRDVLEVKAVVAQYAPGGEGVGGRSCKQIGTVEPSDLGDHRDLLLGRWVSDPSIGARRRFYGGAAMAVVLSGEGQDERVVCVKVLRDLG